MLSLLRLLCIRPCRVENSRNPGRRYADFSDVLHCIPRISALRRLIRLRRLRRNYPGRSDRQRSCDCRGRRARRFRDLPRLFCYGLTEFSERLEAVCTYRRDTCQVRERGRSASPAAPGR
jgi:hypothetical protein